MASFFVLNEENENNWQEAEKSFSFLDAASSFVQRTTFDLDTARLLIGHIRRIGLGLLTYPEVFGYQPLWLDALIQSSGPILTFAGFLIYLPRSVLSAITLYQELSVESDLPLKARLYALYEKDDRLFNLINDFPSILAGFISVFILTASTAWLAAYLTVAVKLWEVIFAAIKCHLDITRLKQLREEVASKPHLTQAEKAYLAHLDEHIAYTEALRTITFRMHALLLPCLAAFTPSLLMLHPAIPILAAVSGILLVCLRFPAFRDLFMSAPEPAEKQLQSLRFFETTPIDKTETPCLDLKLISIGFKHHS